MRLFYNVLFLIFFVLSSPYYFWRLWRRGNWQQGFAQRFGFYPQTFPSFKGERLIWFHAVSVGEVNLCVQLIKQFIKERPEFRIVASTTTTTGMAELTKKLPPEITKVYYPIDWNRAVKKALDTFRPEAIVLIEAEIWPNFLWEAQRRQIPLFLFNARLSRRSFGRYLKAGFIFRNIFSSFTTIGVQDKLDRQRLIALGAAPENIVLTGNLKFDGAPLTLDDKLDVPQMLTLLGVPSDAPVLVAGSTHAGEEVLLAEMALRLKAQFPNFFLILVPRHFERCKALLPELKATGIRFILRTEMPDGLPSHSGGVDCLLVNTTGELRHFYGAATLCFVGKSLTAKGGQNPIEPAALSKPVLFGPNMQNFSSIVESFLSHDAVIQVADTNKLEQQIVSLLTNPSRRNMLGAQAHEVVLQNQGGVERSVQILCSHIKAK
ncbi:MAG: 3-deoxy-D-manno-octulosonic acid transferase [Limisphaerales bacterium]|jgi:3-deoxy-D-manno-octulosonic-acid transferase